MPTSWSWAAAALAVAAIVGALQAHGTTTGSVPLLHLGQARGFNRASIPDLTGRTALVTGATSGLGLGVARLLAGANATLIVTGRSVAKCAAALADVRRHAPDGALISCVELELLSLNATARAAAAVASAVKARSSRGLELLVANAGIMMPPSLLRSADGIEAQFATNHLGHFHLANLLMPQLREAGKSGGARVVAVSSLAHNFAPSRPPLSLAELNDESAYSSLRSYGWSKLANILWSRELTRREPGVCADAVHPGVVDGNILRYSMVPEWIARAAMSWIAWDVETAALTVMAPLVRTGADEGQVSGEDQRGCHGAAGRYFVPIGRERAASAQAGDAALARRLWEWSEELVAQAGA